MEPLLVRLKDEDSLVREAAAETLGSIKKNSDESEHIFLAGLDRVSALVDGALDWMDGAFGERTMTVMSALAEGADRLVVERVLARPEGALIALLPLPQSDYMTDFDSPESRDGFLDFLAQADEVITLPPSATHEDAYAAAGHYVLEHCDVLLAIWDGKGAQGRGGTADIVLEARRRGLPLAWVHAGNRRPGTHEAVSLGDEQGLVTFERFTGTQSQRGHHNGP